MITETRGPSIALLGARRQERGRIYRRHSARGQSLVEFALVLPSVIVVAFGIVQLILLLRADNAVEDLARQYVQILALQGQCQEGCLKALARGEGLSSDSLQVVVTATSADGSIHALPATYGDEITVNVTYDYSFVVPLLGDQVRPLSATAAQASMAFQGS